MWLMTLLKAISMQRWLTTTGLALISILFPTAASAHEVYVLSPEEINTAIHEPSVSFYDIFLANVSDTLIWGAIVGFMIMSVFLISISATLETKFDGYLVKLKRYAPFVSRVTVGLAFIMCGYEAALFGPELPFESLFGVYAPVMRVLFALLGGMMIFGVYTRIVGLISLVIIGVGVWQHGFYMLTYLNYFAEFLVLILIGGHKFVAAEEHTLWSGLVGFFNHLSATYGEFAFLFLRVGFGFSLIYASVYAKILHNQLAIAVVNDFNLVSVFGFNPEFIVFGAAIVEILLGVFFILGIEIRFNAIVINIFLTLSLLYFGEAVWPHIILIGIPIAFFCYGYDKYSLEGYFFKRGNREPIF